MKLTACCLSKNPANQQQQTPASADPVATGQDHSTNQVAAPPLGSLPWESPRHLGLRGPNGNSAAPSPNLLPDPYSLVSEMAPAATQWQEEGIWAPARFLSPLVPPPLQIKQSSPSPAGLLALSPHPSKWPHAVAQVSLSLNPHIQSIS